MSTRPSYSAMTSWTGRTVTVGCHAGGLVKDVVFRLPDSGGSFPAGGIEVQGPRRDRTPTSALVVVFLAVGVACFRLAGNGGEALALVLSVLPLAAPAARSLFPSGRRFRRRHGLEHRVIGILEGYGDATPVGVLAVSPYTLCCGSRMPYVLLLLASASLVAGWGGLVAALVLDLALNRWAGRTGPGHRLARLLNRPFVSGEVTGGDCVLGAEMVCRVREAAGSSGT